MALQYSMTKGLDFSTLLDVRCHVLMSGRSKLATSVRNDSNPRRSSGYGLQHQTGSRRRLESFARLLITSLAHKLVICNPKSSSGHHHLTVLLHFKKTPVTVVPIHDPMNQIKTRRPGLAADASGCRQRSSICQSHMILTGTVVCHTSALACAYIYAASPPLPELHSLSCNAEMQAACKELMRLIKRAQCIPILFFQLHL